MSNSWFYLPRVRPNMKKSQIFHNLLYYSNTCGENRMHCYIVYESGPYQTCEIPCPWVTASCLRTWPLWPYSKNKLNLRKSFLPLFLKSDFPRICWNSYKYQLSSIVSRHISIFIWHRINSKLLPKKEITRCSLQLDI